MGFQTSDLESITLLFIAIGTALGALITTCCWNIRRSRCVQLDLCCLHCTRELMSKSYTETDARQTMHMLHEQTEEPDKRKNTKKDGGRNKIPTRPRPPLPSRDTESSEGSDSNSANDDGRTSRTPSVMENAV